MSTFKCRSTKPTVSDWKEIEAESHTEAGNEFHFRNDGIKHYHWAVESDGTRYTVDFLMIEVEGFGEFISRVFNYGIWRKGGVKRRNAPTLKDIADALGWTKNPQALLEEGWDGEETMEDATKRKFGNG
jgi:hypothetical protein